MAIADWVHVTYAIRGESSVLRTVEREIYRDICGERRLVYHELERIPPGLWHEYTDLAFEIAVVLEYLGDIHTDFDKYSISSLYQDHLAYMQKNALYTISTHIRDDLDDGYPGDRRIVDYLRDKHLSDTKMAIQMLKNKREYGYYSLPGFCLEHYGTIDICTFNNRIITDDAEIRGSFVAAWSAPGLFFSTLQSIYPVQLRVLCTHCDYDEIFTIFNDF